VPLKNLTYTLISRLLVFGLLIACFLMNRPVSAQRPVAEHRNLPLPQNFDKEVPEYSIGQTNLAQEEIDRAVLNRLMQEIAQAPQRTASITGIEEESLAEIFVSLSNAKNFINIDEIRNIRAMCETWANSNFQGEARVRESLNAYAARRQLTLNFVESFYQKVFDEIKRTLSATERSRFNHYMNDRRRRMADAVTSSQGLNFYDVRGGAGTINLYCRNSRPI